MPLIHPTLHSRRVSIAGSQGTKEQVSHCCSKRHLSTLASNGPKYDSLLGPAASQGAVQFLLCLTDWPHLWQHLRLKLVGRFAEIMPTSEIPG